MFILSHFVSQSQSISGDSISFFFNKRKASTAIHPHWLPFGQSDEGIYNRWVLELVMFTDICKSSPNLNLTNWIEVLMQHLVFKLVWRSILYHSQTSLLSFHHCYCCLLNWCTINFDEDDLSPWQTVDNFVLEFKRKLGNFRKQEVIHKCFKATIENHSYPFLSMTALFSPRTR